VQQTSEARQAHSKVLLKRFGKTVQHKHVKIKELVTKKVKKKQKLNKIKEGTWHFKLHLEITAKFL
jgi:hypothetical protein